jgi:hypothetical protein
MAEQTIENYINEFLIDTHKNNALDFISYLRTNDMLFERGGGYWEGKLYWYIKFKDEYVFYVLIGSEEKPGHGPWIIWSDDSNSDCYEDFQLEENIKEIAWKNVVVCGNCGGCSKGKGTNKMIFGKEFQNTCITTMKFIDPDTETIKCLEKLMEIRKKYILKNIDV